MRRLSTWFAISMSESAVSNLSYYLSLLNGLNSILIAADAKEHIVFANALAHEVLGKDMVLFVEPTYQSAIRLLHEDLSVWEADALPLKQVLQGQALSNLRGFLALQETHEKILVSINGIPLPNQGGLIVVQQLLGGSVSPNSVVAQANKIAEKLATRALFVSCLKAALTFYRQRPTHIMAVCYFDIERLRWINTRLGHAFGDQLLAALSLRLAEQVGINEVAAHIGSDQFAILINGAETVTQVIERVEQLLGIIAQAFEIQQQTVCVTAKFGIAFASTGYQNAEDWLQDAAIAMKQAKTAIDSHCQIFDQALKAERDRRLQIEAWLGEALQKQQFRLHYQAIVAVSTQKIVGLEALLRWQHPKKGLLMPIDFLSVVEETNMIIPIGWWVLREACYQMTAWKKAFPAYRGLTLSVNMSSKQFAQKDLSTRIKALLRETNFPAEKLIIEITESDLIENSETIINSLMALKDLGIKLSIDDFGTGYSSLGYLHQFPFDNLKIDRSFLKNFEEDYEKLGILQSIVKLAWNLGLEVVAEGVETHKHYAQVKALRCESGQGYLFARPMSSDNFQDLLASKLA